jgi:hypothetical protein
MLIFSFLQFSVASSPSGPKILFSTLSSNTFIYVLLLWWETLFHTQIKQRAKVIWKIRVVEYFTGVYRSVLFVLLGKFSQWKN